MPKLTHNEQVSVNHVTKLHALLRSPLKLDHGLKSLSVGIECGSGLNEDGVTVVAHWHSWDKARFCLRHHSRFFSKHQWKAGVDAMFDQVISEAKEIQDLYDKNSKA